MISSVAEERLTKLDTLSREMATVKAELAKVKDEAKVKDDNIAKVNRALP